MTKIEEFVKKLNHCEKFDKLRYDVKNNDFTDSIVENIRTKNIDSLVKVFTQFKENEYLCIPHPILGIDTYALMSQHSKMCNYILMSDSDMENPWLLCQSENLFDTFFLPDEKLYYIMREETTLPSLANLKYIINKDNFLKNMIENQYEFKKLDGLIISSHRPFHFFYDQLFALSTLIDEGIKLKTLYDVQFFPVKEINRLSKRKTKGTGLSLSPKLVSMLYFSQDKNKMLKYIEPMEKKLLKSSLNYTKADTKNILNSLENTHEKQLVLWFGLSAEKRGWIEIEQGCVEIINQLNHYFENITVLYDGLTSSIGELVNTEKENILFNNIVRGTPKDIKHIPIYGLEYPDKIVLSTQIDICITGGGSATIVPMRICRKPTVIHSNHKMTNTVNPPSGNIVVKKRDVQYTITRESNHQGQAQHASYHIPWQHIFNLAADVLEDIKNVKIKRLNIPLVDELVVRYEDELFALDSFENLDKKIKATDTSADILRDVALSFEAIDDIDTAFKIMNQAYLLRPKGPLIIKKLAEYKKILEKDNHETP